jgi:hypothetical protein
MREYQDTGVTVDIREERGSCNSFPSRLKPGLHGRARIWGPNRTTKMVLLTTALMG